MTANINYYSLLLFNSSRDARSPVVNWLGCSCCEQGARVRFPARETFVVVLIYDTFQLRTHATALHPRVTCIEHYHYLNRDYHHWESDWATGPGATCLPTSKGSAPPLVIARATFMLERSFFQHLVALVEFYQCAKFRGAILRLFSVGVRPEEWFNRYHV